jgi:nitrogen fixation/metabolism regulation signal transduction histidine kinase
VSFVNPKLGKSFSSFYSALNEIIIQLKDSKLEKESQFELFKLMLEKISVGIIALDEENNMVLINSSARTLLNIPNLISYERFAERRPLFSEAIVELQQYGGRKLVEVFEG